MATPQRHDTYDVDGQGEVKQTVVDRVLVLVCDGERVRNEPKIKASSDDRGDDERVIGDGVMGGVEDSEVSEGIGPGSQGGAGQRPSLGGGSSAAGSSRDVKPRARTGGGPTIDLAGDIKPGKKRKAAEQPPRPTKAARDHAKKVDAHLVQSLAPAETKSEDPNAWLKQLAAHRAARKAG